VARAVVFHMMNRARGGVGGVGCMVGAVWLACGLGCSSSERWPDGAPPGMETLPPTMAAPDAPAPDPGSPSGAAGGPGSGVAVGGGEAAGDPELPLAPSVPTPSGPSTTRFLSELCAASEQNGWGPIERDLSNGEQEAGDGGPLSLANVVYGKGLGMHAPSEAAFALDARCTRLTALVGVDDEMKAAGSVRFEV
jgi:NPCBM/NEW2 domain-containing protein